MNVTAIWSGDYYAFWEYKGNKAFVMNARKGKCIRTEKVAPQWGGERAKAYAIFEEIDPETNEVIHNEVRIRARDVIDEWDAYENERNGIRRERQEAERIATEERERRNAEREERIRQDRELREARERQAAERDTKLIEAFLARTSMPKELVTSVGMQLVCLDRTALEFWLSIPDNRGAPLGSHSS